MLNLFSRVYYWFFWKWIQYKDRQQGKIYVDENGREIPRSNQWPKIRKQHLTEEPKCAWCGGTNNLEVHHISAFHLNPTDELNDGPPWQKGNLITLCEEEGTNCHLHHGHPVIVAGKITAYNFKNGINPNVRKDCATHTCLPDKN